MLSRGSALAAVLMLALAATAQAHFVWISTQTEGAKLAVSAGFGEPGEWDADNADKIGHAKYYVRNAEGVETPVELKREADAAAYKGASDVAHPVAVVGVCEYGVLKRGQAPAMRLRYFAKALTGKPETWALANGSEKLVLDVGAKLDGDAVVLTVFSEGKPTAGLALNLFAPGASEAAKAETDANGQYRWKLTGGGEYTLYAAKKFADKGEIDGKAFESQSQYCTLAFVAPGEKKAGDKTAKAASDDPEEEGHAHGHAHGKVAGATNTFPVLPEAVSSFGGVYLDGHIYVYSGHQGRAHAHSSDNLSTHFRRLNVAKPEAWEELPVEKALQGVAMTTHNGKLLRVGGMFAKNKTAEESQELESIAEVAEFDPATKTWKQLTPMPEPRSTHDAVAIDGKLYVVGGWALGGKDGEKWHEDSIVLDLTAEKPEWKTIAKQPFVRRALAIGRHGDKLVSIGGIGDDGVTLASHVYDPQTDKWSAGPELPSDSAGAPAVGGMMMGGATMNGFGAAVTTAKDRLYCSVMSGDVYRLTAAGDAWERIGGLAVPRFFHEIGALEDGRLIAFGGAGSWGNPAIVETITSEPTPGRTEVVSVTYPIEAVHSQGMSFSRGVLTVFGGNKSPSPHAFEAENFSAQAYRVNLLGLSVDPIADLPKPRMSMGVEVVATAGPARGGRPGADGGARPEGNRDGANRGEARRGGGMGMGAAAGGSIVAIGGLGFEGEAFGSQPDVLSYDAAKNTWKNLGPALEDRRSMGGFAVSEGKVFAFGGSVVGGDHSDDYLRTVLSLSPAGDAPKFQPTGAEAQADRRAFAGVTLNGVYYIFGGINPETEVAKDAVTFDLTSKEWKTIAAPASPRVFADAAVVAGKIYLVGGFTPAEGGRMAFNPTIEVYDPAANSWTKLPGEGVTLGARVRAFSLPHKLLLVATDPHSKQIKLAFVDPL